MARVWAPALVCLEKKNSDKETEGREERKLFITKAEYLLTDAQVSLEKSCAIGKFKSFIEG